MVRTVVVGEPPIEIAQWLERRRRLGQDLFDEVWDGEYHVAPAAHRRHGDLDAQIGALLHEPARTRGLWPSGPANIGELNNFRVPDHSIFAGRATRSFEPTAALVVEIVSPGDESYDKFDFYFDHGVEEVLIVDPQTRQVLWFTRSETRFVPTERSPLLDMTVADLAAAIDWPD